MGGRGDVFTSVQGERGEGAVKGRVMRGGGLGPVMWEEVAVGVVREGMIEILQ